MLRHPLPSRQPPPLAQLAYLDLSEIAHHRQTKLAGPAPPLGAHYRRNMPGSRRVQKQLRLLTPRDRYEDPYIAALLIALAQEQRLHSKGDGNDNNEKNFSTGATSATTPWQCCSTAPLALHLRTRHHLGSEWSSTAGGWPSSRMRRCHGASQPSYVMPAR
ncbi:hypothetical protein B0H63DRAFT_526930 [Podospora didyma]|uniref:Uncharacterized protein n=1 Tax=Podospora didyma TaxID=330526 RepID=A0AAE0K8K7_9PEZI|nr:hypothetical protein B0H63DRAFT_526930 [Podospora didyma]